MKNKGSVSIILVLSLVVIAGALYFFSSRSASQKTALTPAPETALAPTHSAPAQEVKATKAAPPSVDGMSEYIDPEFKFAFWYPSKWSVDSQRTSGGFAGGTMYHRIIVSNEKGVEVVELSGITYKDSKIIFTLDQFDCTTTYFFDQRWMEQKTGSQCNTSPEAHPYAGLNTAVGLPILEAQYTSLSIKNLIPLEGGAGTHFVAVYLYPDTVTGTALPLARTVTPLTSDGSAYITDDLIRAITDEQKRFANF